MVTILEVMGRNAGWLTASTAIAAYKGQGPDLIYLPEIDFDLDTFLSDVKKVYATDKKCIIAVSEGVRTKDGKYLPELVGELSKDAFGHAQMGGTATLLAGIVKDRLGCKIRAIEFSLLQRCAAHLASQTDVDESYLAGQTAVQVAIAGGTDQMVAFKRAPGKDYACEIQLIPLDDVANTEKKIPRSWINAEGNFVTQDFIDYVLPLIQGESRPPMIDGLPRFAKLRKVSAAK
jgi:6-phosphofructokinase 1